VATRNRSEKVRLWDVLTGELVAVTPLRSWEALNFTPDGRWLTALDQWHRPQLYELAVNTQPLEELQRLAEVLSGHEIDGTGGYVPVAEDPLAKAWQQLKEDWPEVLQPAPAQLLAWHRRKAEDCEAGDNWAEAVQHLTALIEAAPKQWSPRLRRGYAYNELGEWGKALADLDQAAAGGGTDNAFLWQQRGRAHAERRDWALAGGDFQSGGQESYQALTLLAQHDRTGYQKVCRGLQAELQKSRGYFDRSAAWVCVLSPDSGMDFIALLPLVEQAMSDGTKDYEDQRLWGAALYRAGKYEAARDRLRAASALPGNADKAVAALLAVARSAGLSLEPQIGISNRLEKDAASCWLLLAMTEYCLGHRQEAERWLKQATQWLDRHAGKALEWHERVSLHALREEGEKMLRPGAK
jgi:tetratricopeptide (TPR) repeat protein